MRRPSWFQVGLAGQVAVVAGYLRTALERYPDLHFLPPTVVATGAGSA